MKSKRAKATDISQKDPYNITLIISFDYRQRNCDVGEVKNENKA